jgi:hypothetical protein
MEKQNLKEINALIKEKDDSGMQYIAKLKNRISRKAGQLIWPMSFAGFLSQILLLGKDEQLVLMAKEQLRRRLKNSNLTQQQITDLVNYCIEPFDNGFLVDALISEPMLYEVPKKYFLLNITLMLIIAIASNVIIALAAGLVLHTIMFLATSKESKRRRQEKIDKIMAGIDVD